MIQLNNTHVGKWDVIQKSTLANIDKERLIGVVRNAPGNQFFRAYVSDKPGAEVIAVVESLPAAIQALIDLHKMTDYQYAPWPLVEEEE